MGPGRTGAGRRKPPRERADSVPHTPGGASPPFKSGCWMLVKNHFFSKCYNRAVTFYFLFFFLNFFSVYQSVSNQSIIYLLPKKQFF